MGIEVNPIIGFESRTSDAVFTATTAASGYAAANMGVLPLNFVWRSSDYTLNNVVAQELKFQYGGSEKAARTFSVVRHNFDLDATFRLQLYSDAAWTTEVYDSDDEDLIGTNEIWPPVYTDEELEWEDENWWTAKYTAAQIAGRTWLRVIDVGALKLHKSGKITITNASNADLHLQCGYLDISRAHQFSRGLALGSSRGGTSNEVKSAADGGVQYVSDGVYKRVFRGGFQYLPRSQAENVIQEMKARYQGKSPFIWHPFPTLPRTWFKSSMFCTFDQLDLGQIAMPLHDTEPLSLKEV